MIFKMILKKKEFKNLFFLKGRNFMAVKEPYCSHHFENIKGKYLNTLCCNCYFKGKNSKSFKCSELYWSSFFELTSG